MDFVLCWALLPCLYPYNIFSINHTKHNALSNPVRTISVYFVVNGGFSQNLHCDSNILNQKHPESATAETHQSVCCVHSNTWLLLRQILHCHQMDILQRHWLSIWIKRTNIYNYYFSYFLPTDVYSTLNDKHGLPPENRNLESSHA